jgi:hypothetical protein
MVDFEKTTRRYLVLIPVTQCGVQQYLNLMGAALI